ncbi:amidase [Paraburkholderia sp. BCC1886]|uniref:amidase n=1 Tax=Paraburkholderia sp. BCC1886 TaxID=2562670 RepID=UPI001182D922|nr:amidase family protein [Paraburkholderia sp. BCC1886]
MSDEIATELQTASAIPLANPLLRLGAHALSDAFRAGELSPVEATRAALEQIDAFDATLHAFCETRFDAALDAARLSEARWRAGAPLSPLDGVPVSIKDHLDVTGFLAPNRGGPAQSHESAFDSPCAARLKEAGAVIVGKTTMPELSVVPVTQTAAWGVTRNPVNLAHSPGGSSGGAAAAVAAGMCTVAIGSDGGGSIRLPAAFTGICGHKPTFGLVPYYPGQTDRTVAGPLARSCADLALAMDVIARPDGRDWTEQSRSDVHYFDALAKPLARLPKLRIGFSATFGYQKPSPGVLAQVEAALQKFAALGLEVERFDRLCDDPFMTYMRQATLRLRGKSAGFSGPEALGSVFRLADSWTADDAQRMIDARTRLADDFMTAFSRYDVIVSPSAPFTAPRVGDFYPDGDITSEDNRNLIGYAAPFNLVHLPALSIPCGTSDGLPVGLQLGGKRFSDALLLQLGAALGSVT